MFLSILLSLSLMQKVIAQNYLKDRFTVGSYNFTIDINKRRPVDLQNYFDLNFNSQLSFTYRGDNDPNWSYADGFIINPVIYLPNFQNTLEVLFNQQTEYHKQEVIFERAKVLRGACGQRSTYQAEYPGTYNTKYPGYGYMSSQTGQDVNDNGTISRFCVVQTDNPPGYIVKDLYENIEQINYKKTEPTKMGMEYYWSDKKDDQYFWVVKPRMRISVDDYNDPNKKELPVIRIDIFRFDGTKISNDEQFTIKVKDFKGLNSTYNGVYFPHFDGQIEKRNFVEKGKQNYGYKESSPNL